MNSILQCWLRTVPALFFRRTAVALLRLDSRFLLLVQSKDILHIGFVDKQLAHFLFCRAVLGIRRFLLSQQISVLGAQALDCR